MPNNLPTPYEHQGSPLPALPGADAPAYRGGAPDAGSGGNLRSLWRRVSGSIWRYKWLVASIALVGAVAGYFVSAAMVKPQYAVNSTIWYEAPRPGALQGPIQASPMLDGSGWMDLLRSFAVIEPVVHEERLFLQPVPGTDMALFDSLQIDATLRPGRYQLQVAQNGRDFVLQNADGDAVQQGALGGPIGEPAGFRWLPPTERLAPGQRVEFALHNPGDVAQQIAAGLRVQARERGNFLAVAMVGDDPQRLATTLNALTTRFVEVAGDLKRAQSEELTGVLQEQLDRAASNLRESESSLQGFRVGTVTLPSDRVIQQAPGLQATQGSVFGDFFMLKTEREQLRRDRESIVAALNGAGGQGISIAALEVVPSVRASSEMSAALADLANKRAELRAMRSQFTDQYIPVQRLGEEVRLIETQTVPRLASNVVREIAQREAQMDARLASASNELRQIPERSIEEARLERSVATASDLYVTLRQRYETARLAAVSTVPDVRVLDAARVPTAPVNGDERMRIFLLFLVGSLGIAFAAPVLIDRMDPRLRYPEQVVNDLGLPILGAVPHIPGADGKRREIGRDSSVNAVEALREIRLNVAHAFGAAGPLLTTVTSAGAGDGKSFITSNLALAFADLGHRTLIIDGDIRRGQMHRLLGVGRIPGLTDYLVGDATIDEIVQPTAFASLDVIPGGTRMQTGPELLGSAAMSGLIREMRGRYDVILVDSPPLGAGVDPFILSTLTGNTLLVVRNGRTDREFASAKLDLLDRLPVRLLGAVLNDVPASGAYRYYSYVPGYEAVGEVAAADTDPEVRKLEGV